MSGIKWDDIGIYCNGEKYYVDVSRDEHYRKKIEISKDEIRGYFGEIQDLFSCIMIELRNISEYNEESQKDGTVRVEQRKGGQLDKMMAEFIFSDNILLNRLIGKDNPPDGEDKNRVGVGKCQ